MFFLGKAAGDFDLTPIRDYSFGDYNLISLGISIVIATLAIAFSGGYRLDIFVT
ncbi:hypothetical protein [Desulfosporosinus fructosivorans]